jgi:hypothetical protein
VAAEMTGATATAGWAQLRRGRWLAAVAAAVLVALYLGAVTSTHAAIGGSEVRWAGPAEGRSAGLGPVTAAERELAGLSAGFGTVLWASRAGGAVTFGFTIHNGGPVPVTLVGLALRTFDPGVLHALAPAGAQAGPESGQLRPLRPVTLGPGGSLPVALTERVVCVPLIRSDARLPDGRGLHSVLGDATSPVVLRYRVLGITTSQTVSLGSPVLVLLPYRACR